jgi:DNA-binding NtrC family response regulator
VALARLISARVVIVDDDVTLLRALALALSDYEPATAQSASEALMLVQHCDPELLITDYLMPNVSGAELIAHARERQPNLKVVMLTGHGAFVENEYELKDVRHLEKPCSVQKLRDAVEDMFGLPPSVENVSCVCDGNAIAFARVPVSEPDDARVLPDAS